VADGPIPPGYDGVTDLVFDNTGEISGACMTLNVACRNFMRHTGASIVDVFRMASLNPSHAMGYHDRGRIAVGLRADLIVVDHRMEVSHVLLAGRLIR
jgi:N-acetylglucosamine-6-phosphate deacetylase